MSQKAVTIHIECPDCSVCGRQIAPAKHYYQKVTRWLELSIVPEIRPRPQIITRFPAEAVDFCSECLPLETKEQLETIVEEKERQIQAFKPAQIA